MTSERKIYTEKALAGGRRKGSSLSLNWSHTLLAVLLCNATTPSPGADKQKTADLYDLPFVSK